MSNSSSFEVQIESKLDMMVRNLEIMKEKIYQISKKFKLNSLLIDDINSNTQSEYLSRAFMIDISDIINGFNIKKKNNFKRRKFRNFGKVNYWYTKYYSKYKSSNRRR